MDSEQIAEPLHVLAVTADGEYAGELAEQLPATGPFQVTVVESAEAAIDRLSGDVSVDCIVSDYDLPDTDGVAFLETVRTRFPTLPFILFTSEGNEAIASRAISADVTEYLVRERQTQWGRLATLIKDATRHSIVRRDLVDTEARSNHVLDAARDTIGIVRDGRFEYVNRAGVDLLGAASTEEVVGRRLADVVETDEGLFTTEGIAELQAGNRVLERVEGTVRRLDNSTVPVELTATRMEVHDGPAVVVVARDISHRKERERELAVIRRAMDTAPIGVTLADATREDNPLVYANEAFLDLTGYPKADVLGGNCRFLQGPDTDDEPVTTMREAIDAEEPVTVTLKNYRKDGTEFWNRVTIAPVTNEAGELTHYVGFQEDVTERKEAERPLRLFRRAVEAAGHAFYMTDPDGTITYVNPAFETITGYDREEAVGQTPRILNSGEMPEGYFEDLWTTVLNGEVWEEKVINRRQSGDLYHARQTIAPVTDGDGEVEAFVAVQTDVTEQKQREERLEQYERAVEGSNDLIAAIGADYRYLFANQLYRDYHGLGRDSVAGARIDEVLEPEVWDSIKPHVDRVLSGEEVKYRMTRYRPHRADRTFDIRYYPLSDEATGEVTGGVATMRDVTEKQERQRQLEVLDRVLRHNLRNSMGVIIGNAELIADRSEGQLQELAETVVETGEDLVALTEHEHEIVQLVGEPQEIQPLELSALVEEAVKEARVTHPGAEVRLDICEPVEVSTISQLRRAVEELIKNAIEHTDRTQPEVEVRVESAPETATVTVADNGPGIPSDEWAMLTDDAEVDQLYHGSGLGLWLVNWIVNRSEGTLTFEVNEPRGSIVRITLPRMAADSDAEGSTSAASGEDPDVS